MRFLLLRQIKWQIYPPYRHLVVKSSSTYGHHDISILKAYIGRSSGRPTPPYSHLVVIFTDQVLDLPPHYSHVVVKSSTMSGHILADQPLPPVVASGG